MSTLSCVNIVNCFMSTSSRVNIHHFVSTSSIVSCQHGQLFRVNIIFTSCQHHLVSTSSRVNIISCQHHPVATSSRGDIISCQHHPVATSSRGDMISCQHHLVSTSSRGDILSWRHDLVSMFYTLVYTACVFSRGRSRSKFCTRLQKFNLKFEILPII